MLVFYHLIVDNLAQKCLILQQLHIAQECALLQMPLKYKNIFIKYNKYNIYYYILFVIYYYFSSSNFAFYCIGIWILRSGI